MESSHQRPVYSTYSLVKVDGVLAGHDILGGRTLGAGSCSSHFCANGKVTGLAQEGLRKGKQIIRYELD